MELIPSIDLRGGRVVRLEQGDYARETVFDADPVRQAQRFAAAGVRRPASVWFELDLRDRNGVVLWSGTYEETQAPLSDDAGSLPRAFERRFRWVTAADLADYGARMLLRELQHEIETWS